MQNRPPRRRIFAFGIVLVVIVVCVAIALQWSERPSTSSAPVLTSIPIEAQSARIVEDLGRADGDQADARHAVATSVEHAPVDVEPPTQPEPRKLSGIEILVRDLRHDLGKLHELKLAGTGERIVTRSVYLREDLLGNSLSMDDEIPKGWLDRHESYTAFKGPNGGRVYSFSREQYPLFYELTGRADPRFEAILDDDLIERITLLAEDAITLSGIPPE